MSNIENVCYFCGKEATSKEHIPPRAFFPKNNRNDLFTVPSCEEHNGAKSKDDEYVKIILGRSADLMLREDLHEVKSTSERAIARNPRLKNTIEVKPEPAIIVLENDIIIPSVSYEIDLERVYGFFNSLSRGLYYHHEKEVWKGKVSIAPHFLIKEDAAQEDLEKHEELLGFFDRSDSHGENKNVFYYTFVYILDDDRVWTGACILSICIFDKFKISMVMEPYCN